MSEERYDEGRTNMPVNQGEADQPLADRTGEKSEGLEPNMRDLGEETAAEMTPTAEELRGGERLSREDESSLRGVEEGYREQMENIEAMEETESGGTVLGWTGLVLSILSLFFLPVLTSTAGIVAGFFAFRGGARTLGLWAIGVGIFSLIMAMFVTPFLVRF